LGSLRAFFKTQLPWNTFVPLRRGKRINRGYHRLARHYSCYPLSQGREQVSPLALSERRSLPSGRASFTSFGLLNLFRFLRLPSESFTSGGVAAFRRKPKEANLFLKKHVLRLSELVSVLRIPPEGRASFGFLREASPLAGWRLSEGSRRKRTCFEKSTSFGFHSKEGRPSASSRRKGVLRLPSGSFTSSGVALSEGSERPSGSFTSGGFLKEASPLALPSESFTSGGVALSEGSERPSGSFTSGGFLRKASPLAA